MVRRGGGRNQTERLGFGAVGFSLLWRFHLIFLFLSSVSFLLLFICLSVGALITYFRSISASLANLFFSFLFKSRFDGYVFRTPIFPFKTFSLKYLLENLINGLLFPFSYFQHNLVFLLYILYPWTRSTVLIHVYEL